jgi:predicted DNA-binding transcriptional regulator AlpA
VSYHVKACSSIEETSMNESNFTAKPQLLLRVVEVARRVGMSPRHVRRLVQLKTFPQPVQLGRRCKRWLADDIDTYIRQLVAHTHAKIPAESVNVFDLSRLEETNP